jgi:steroid delta-isomerase-like uncharacterized protein
MSESVIKAYYDAFNRQDVEGMLACLTDDVAHDVNEGKREIGKDAFKKFLERMNVHYKETLEDIIIMLSKDQRNAAAEFYVNGTYLKTDPGLPEARGQTYKIKAGAFLELKENKISRVTMYYNLKHWINLVS